MDSGSGRGGVSDDGAPTQARPEAGATDHPVHEIAAAWERERPGTPVSSIRIVTPIWQLAKLFGDDRSRVLARAGVDAATLDLLSVLRRSGPPYTLSTRELSQRSLVTAGAVSQRVARAEREGLVKRHPAQGRPRTVRVTLTTTGHEVVEATVDHVLHREAELISGLTSDQQTQLAELLCVLLQQVQHRADDNRITHVGQD
ncbi:winged helix-turn-helix transcriptional regulator [Actinomadura soli]|uniref:Winged helix-turn-helix transcriptional regulator n=1 Tax=Actinomadura soli TaxID=2508997 RepID=A0A5C4JFU4_9ACTN|nr:winged helix-turn-helix transcriptional regulator [Actinomadura soli]